MYSLLPKHQVLGQAFGMLSFTVYTSLERRAQSALRMDFHQPMCLCFNNRNNRKLAILLLSVRECVSVFS